MVMVMMVRPCCELCPSHASLFCPSDSAFLCCSCDALVHRANFLVARHFRYLLCSSCHRFTARVLSGAALSFFITPATCLSCQHHLHTSSSSSSSSSSSTAHRHRNNYYKAARRYPSAECIFVNWCSRLGVAEEVDLDLIVRTACRALPSCAAVLPFRVCLAASTWLGLMKLSHGSGECRQEALMMTLKRLEEVSGVPAKIILAAERKLERALRQEDRGRRLKQLAEGWAEC